MQVSSNENYVFMIIIFLVRIRFCCCCWVQWRRSIFFHHHFLYVDSSFFPRCIPTKMLKYLRINWLGRLMLNVGFWLCVRLLGLIVSSYVKLLMAMVMVMVKWWLYMEQQHIFTIITIIEVQTPVRLIYSTK